MSFRLRAHSIFLFTALGLCLGILGGTIDAFAAQQDSGRSTFESICAACHGLDGRGGERGPDISSRPAVVQHSDAEILAILKEGRLAGGMPPYEALGAEKLKALIAYLRSLQGRASAQVLPGDTTNGKTLFFGKARCADCHTIRGEGGFFGRDLSAYGSTASATDLRNKLSGAVPISPRANRLTTVTLKNSQRFTGVVRNEDNFSIQLQSLDGTFHFLKRSDATSIELSPDPIMPTNYGQTLTQSEFDDLVKFILTANGSQNEKPKNKWEEED